VLQEMLSWRPQTKENYVENIRILYVECPVKTTVVRSLQLDVPKAVKQNIYEYLFRKFNFEMKQRYQYPRKIKCTAHYVYA
jgi:hypothetical protein